MEKKHLNIYLEHTNITCFTECSFLWLYISWEMTPASQQECRGILELGCTQTLNLVWSFSDIANALMAIPNLICMLILSKEVAQAIKAFQPEIDNRHTEKRSEQNTYVQDVK